MTISLNFFNFLKWLLFIVAVFFIAIVVIFFLYNGFEKKYSDKYFPGTRVANMDIGGLTRQEAEQELNQKIDAIKESGVSFAYYNEQATLDLLLTSTGADIAWPVIMFDINEAMETAYYYARTESWLYNIKERIFLWNLGKDFPIHIVARKEEIDNFLDKNFSHFSTPAQNAKLIATTSPYKKIVEFGISEEIYGQALDFGQAIGELRQKLAVLDNSTIFLKAVIQYPQVYKKDCFNIETMASDIIKLAPLVLAYNEQEWFLERNDLLLLMELKSRKAKNGLSDVYVGLDDSRTKEFLKTKIAPDINKETVDAKFEIINGKVEQFQINQDGLELDEEASFEILEKAILIRQKEAIRLATKIIKSKNSNDEMNDLGIKEIIGTGYSDFSGSPNNRRHNIQTGAESVNGTLIAPNEEFSLLRVLGEINAETGYLPELVIKEGKTIPEYGGGLCQIGTTVFRATIDSGLPVTMRRNHSYRVSYYEPAGTDATIYDPWPDYKFKNDTKHHILIQSRIEGNILYFDFWGTNDGRVATSTYPVIYNIKKPGPTKMIETLDLEPGEKRCTEHAHNGADAYFDYKITYPDGEVAEKRFKSHYVPWQAVCLIGVEELAADKEKREVMASSTEAISIEDKE